MRSSGRDMRDDRDTIFSYIERENPRAAVHVDEEIAGAVRRSATVPLLLAFRSFQWITILTLPDPSGGQFVFDSVDA